jgi:hypothetical protein
MQNTEIIKWNTYHKNEELCRTQGLLSAAPTIQLENYAKHSDY